MKGRSELIEDEAGSNDVQSASGSNSTRGRPLVSVEPVLRRLTPAVVCAACLTAVVGVQPLYSDNQNTYLLRGIAGSVADQLRADRLVTTSDPTRFFTWIVRVLYGSGMGPPAMYVLWGAAALCFFVSLWWATAPRGAPRAGVVVWAGLIGLLLSPSVQPLAERARSVIGLDVPLPGQMLDGVAGQYALGRVLQPSSSAVLLVAGIALGLRGNRIRTAVGLLWLAAVIHPSYLLAAWVLLLGMLTARHLTDGATKMQLVQPVVLAVVASVVVLLVDQPTFSSIADDDRDAGNELLAMFRIPHHSDPATWFGYDTVVKVAVIGLATLVACRSRRSDERRFGSFLGITTGLVFALTLAVVVAGSASAKLLFPWRASVVLVPLAVSYLLARLAVYALRATWFANAPKRLAGLAAIVLLFVVSDGARESVDRLRSGPADSEIVEAVRRADPSGEGLVPTAMGDLRLNAQVPVYVDWKNNPNAPSAIVDWWERVDRADRAMSDPGALCRLVAAEHFGWVIYPVSLDSPDAPACLSTWDTTRVDGFVLAVNR